MVTVTVENQKIYFKIQLSLKNFVIFWPFFDRTVPPPYLTVTQRSHRILSFLRLKSTSFYEEVK